MKLLTLITLITSFDTNTLPISLEDGELNSGKMFVPCQIEGLNDRCQLDTGAGQTILQFQENISHHKSEGSKQVASASGNPISCDLITLSRIQVGDRIQTDYQINRCKSGNPNHILGMDYFHGSIMNFQFNDSDANAKTLLTKVNTLDQYATGQISIKLNLDHQQINGLWDTGAGLTVINKNLVENNPDLFELVSDSIDAVDGTGKPVNFKLYKARSIVIDTHEFQDVFMLAYDFDFIHQHFPDVNIILGYNVIVQKNWQINLKNMTWNIL